MANEDVVLDHDAREAAIGAYNAHSSGRCDWQALSVAIRVYLRRAAQPVASAAPADRERVRIAALVEQLRNWRQHYSLTTQEKRLFDKIEAALKDKSPPAPQLSAAPADNAELVERLRKSYQMTNLDGSPTDVALAIAALQQESPRAVVKLDDEHLVARLKELAAQIFPSANKYAVQGVKRIISILERVSPDEYAILHASMYPLSTGSADDMRADEDAGMRQL